VAYDFLRSRRQHDHLLPRVATGRCIKGTYKVEVDAEMLSLLGLIYLSIDLCGLILLELFNKPNRALFFLSIPHAPCPSPDPAHA
jgi:hypothetical protein